MLSPSSTILPPWLTKLLASKEPVFLITPARILSAATADKMIRPPGACTAWRFSIRVAMVDGVVVMPSKLPPPSKFKVMDSPAAMTTAPARASTTPELRTSGASSAM